MKKIINRITLIIILMSVTGCKITNILYPSNVLPGDSFELSFTIVDKDVPENNIHKGLIGLIIPSDWVIEDADYSFELGNGKLNINNEWCDTLKKSYPETDYGNNYKWVALVSDNGYSYKEQINVNVKITLRTSNKDGFYNFGILTTKASPGMVSSSNFNWAPLIYPNSITVSNSPATKQMFEVQKAEQWNKLFDRVKGWTGADGIYSVPLNEDEREENNSEHLLLFSDTFIGDVDSNKQRRNSTLVNNTMAILKEGNNSEENAEFIYKKDSALFIPDTEESKPGDWYWLMDGIKINNKIYTYELRLDKKGDGAFGFNTIATNLIKFNLDDSGMPVNIEQFDTPLFYTSEQDGTKITLGQAIMPLHNASENYVTDGYIYVYGPKGTSNKQLVCSRVLPENIENFDKYEYWDGANWCNDISKSAPVTDRISQEFSISPLKNGKFLLLFQVGDYVAYRLGESPVGPFGAINIIYEAPEVEISKDVFIYNAKAHPSLSQSDEILISYNVNTFSIVENMNNADIYRPRFITLKLNEEAYTSIKDECNLINDSFLILDNYPNPFNPTTTIHFEINVPNSYSLTIYNSIGQIVEQVFKNKEFRKGSYNLGWNASDYSSGVYLYELKSKSARITKKMVLVK